MGKYITLLLAARLKKPRVVSTLESDEDEVKALFSQKLSHFKKSPLKKGLFLSWSVQCRFINICIDKRRSAPSSDDDEFNPTSEQDEDDGRSYRSSSSRRSAALSSDTEGDFIVDDEDEDNPRKSKSKLTAKTGKKVKGKATVADNLEASNAGTASVAAFTLLTAAERREQGKKLEKKSTEEAFAFLQDVRDVRRFYIGLMCIDIVIRKTAGNLETPNMIPERFLYPQRHGKNSRRLKSRCVAPRFCPITPDYSIYSSSGRLVMPNISFLLKMLITCLQIKQNHYDTVCNIVHNVTVC